MTTQKRHQNLRLYNENMKENMGFLHTKSRLRPFSATPLGCKELVPKFDMQSMERFELYLRYEGII